jgi:ATP-dependent RNA helicase DeaD
MINENTRNRKIEIGKIEIMKKFSFFEIEKKHEQDILKAFSRNVKFEGMKVVVEVSKPDHAKNKSREKFKKDKRNYKGPGKRRARSKK